MSDSQRLLEAREKERAFLSMDYAKGLGLFAYEQWNNATIDERDLYHEAGESLSDELDALDGDSTKLYDLFCESCLETEKSGFIAGFAFAYHCLKNGRVMMNLHPSYLDTCVRVAHEAVDDIDNSDAFTCFFLDFEKRFPEKKGVIADVYEY